MNSDPQHLTQLVPRCLPMVVVLAALCSCADGTSPSTGAVDTGFSSGTLTVEPPRVEFEAPDDNDIDSHRVELRLVNTGNEPLQIRKIETRCGCTVPDDLTRHLLPPGESEWLVVSVSPPAYGKRETLLVVMTDSAATPRVHVPVVLHGPNLRPPYVEGAPSQVRVFGRQPGQLVEQEVLIRTLESPGAPWVSALVSTQESVETRLVEVASEERLSEEAVRRTYRFVIRSRTPDSPHLIITDNLALATGPDESIKGLPNISLVASFMPAIRAVPQEIQFRADDDSRFPMEQSVLLIATDDTPWDLSPPEGLPSWLEVVEDGLPDDTGFGPRRLRMRITDGVRAVLSDERRVCAASVRIPCSHPDCNHVLIAISVTH